MRNFVIAVLLALFCFTALSFGQAQDSILVGAVTDSSGSAVPGATVTATNKDTGVKYTSVTSSVGEYVSTTYRSAGTMFRPRPRDSPLHGCECELQLNHTASVNLTLP